MFTKKVYMYNIHICICILINILCILYVFSRLQTCMRINCLLHYRDGATFSLVQSMLGPPTTPEL